jgi:hypothetical protein
VLAKVQGSVGLIRVSAPLVASMLQTHIRR